MLWTLALRNVLRNRRRSVITVLSIAIGLAALTFLWGFIDGMNREMVENTTRYFAGDAEVHLAGYHEDPGLERTLAEGGVALLQSVRTDGAVAAASPRLEAMVLASRGDKSRGVRAVGVDPAQEAQVTQLFKAVVAGSGFAGATDDGVLVGEQLADALRLAPGDELVIVGQGWDGSVAGARLPVRGVFSTRIDELDGYLVVMTLPRLREVLGAPEALSTVAIRLNDRGVLDQVLDALQRTLGPRYEALGWPTLLPMVAVSVRYHEVMGYVVLTIFFVMVAAAVANPVLMAVLERTREFGVMLAIGTSPGRLLRLVLCEAMILGAAGLLLGNAAGLGVTALLHNTGIDLGAFGAGLRTMPGLSDVIRPVVRLERSLWISGLVFLMAVLVALHPAFKAARLRPVEALRGLATGEVRLGRGGARHAAARWWPVFMVIALRNVLRNPRRSAITAGATAFAIVAYVFLYGYFDGFGEQIVDNSTRYLTGHLQIERPGLRRELAPELAFEDGAALAAAVAALPGVRAAAPRVQVQALASSAARSEGIVLLGVEPQAERDLTVIHRAIVEGQALAPDTDRDVVVGRQLAQRLGLRLGEKLVVMAPGAGGELGTAAYRIRGIFATESSAFDRGMAFVTLRAGQSLLGLGSKVSSVNVRLADREGVGLLAPRVQPLLAVQGLVAVPWQQLMPQVADMLGLIRAIRSIVVAVFFLVVALAVLNTVFMAVAERTREFGVMMALGTAPGAIVRMVVYESLILMTVASVVGYAMGAALVLYLGRVGLDLSSLYRGYSSIPGLTGMAYPRLVLGSLVGPGVALYLGAIAVSLYPAMRAARLDPSTAIRHT
jgi:ABC-type lipoprotein release transport system permease subunit